MWKMMMAGTLALAGCATMAPPPDFGSVAGAVAAMPQTTSVLLMQHGAVLYESYLGEGAPDHLNDPRSATKVLTSMAVGIAVADGVIASADAPVMPFFAELAPFAHDDPLKRTMTFADLMSMASPLACDDGDPATPGNEDHMHEHDDWTRFIVDLPVKKSAVRDATGRYPFAYCTVNAVLTGQAVGRAEKTGFDAFVDTRILTPLGISGQVWQRSPSGEPMSGGGLRLTTRQMAAIGQLILDRGAWQGKQIVPAAWIDAMTTGHRIDPRGRRYGYFLFGTDIQTACGTTAVTFLGGNGGTVVMIVPKLDAVAVVTRTAFNVKGVGQAANDFLEKELLSKLPCPKAP